MSEQPVKRAEHRWYFAGLDWEYDRSWSRSHRWGVSDGCCGGLGRNPVAAYLALRSCRRNPGAPQ